jgi:hypothetical protein
LDKECDHHKHAYRLAQKPALHTRK